MNGKCYLCQKEADLRLSRIVPRFVTNWLKETSPGAIRDSHVLNRWIQDGVKECMLCEAREELFGSWEHAFADKIFFPLMESEVLCAMNQDVEMFGSAASKITNEPE